MQMSDGTESSLNEHYRTHKARLSKERIPHQVASGHMLS